MATVMPPTLACSIISLASCSSIRSAPIMDRNFIYLGAVMPARCRQLTLAHAQKI